MPESKNKHDAAIEVAALALKKKQIEAMYAEEADKRKHLFSAEDFTGSKQIFTAEVQFKEHSSSSSNEGATTDEDRSDDGSPHEDQTPNTYTVTVLSEASTSAASSTAASTDAQSYTFTVTQPITASNGRIVVKSDSTGNIDPKTALQLQLMVVFRHLAANATAEKPLSEIHFHQFTGLPEGVKYIDGSTQEEGIVASVNSKPQFTFTSGGKVETINADKFILETLRSFKDNDALRDHIQSVDSLNVFMPGENSPLVKTPTVEKDTKTKTKKTLLQSGAEFLQTRTAKGLALGVGTAAALYWLFQQEGAASTIRKYVQNDFMQSLRDLIMRLGPDSTPEDIRERINTFFSSVDLETISPQDESVLHRFVDNGNSLPAVLSVVGQTMTEWVGQNTSNLSLPIFGNGSFNSTGFQMTPIFMNVSPLTVYPSYFIRGLGSLVLPNMPSALYSVFRSANASVTPSHSFDSDQSVHTGDPSSGSGVSTQRVGGMPVSDAVVTFKRKNANEFSQLNASHSVGQDCVNRSTRSDNLKSLSFREEGAMGVPSKQTSENLNQSHSENTSNTLHGPLLPHGNESPQGWLSLNLSPFSVDGPELLTYPNSINLGGGSDSSDMPISSRLPVARSPLSSQQNFCFFNGMGSQPNMDAFTFVYPLVPSSSNLSLQPHRGGEAFLGTGDRFNTNSQPFFRTGINRHLVSAARNPNHFIFGDLNFPGTGAGSYQLIHVSVSYQENGQFFSYNVLCLNVDGQPLSSCIYENTSAVVATNTSQNQFQAGQLALTGGLIEDEDAASPMLTQSEFTEVVYEINRVSFTLQGKGNKIFIEDVNQFFVGQYSSNPMTQSALIEGPYGDMRRLLPVDCMLVGPVSKDSHALTVTFSGEHVVKKQLGDTNSRSLVLDTDFAGKVQEYSSRATVEQPVVVRTKPCMSAVQIAEGSSIVNTNTARRIADDRSLVQNGTKEEIGNVELPSTGSNKGIATVSEWSEEHPSYGFSRPDDNGAEILVQYCSPGSGRSAIISDQEQLNDGLCAQNYYVALSQHYRIPDGYPGAMLSGGCYPRVLDGSSGRQEVVACFGDLTSPNHYGSGVVRYTPPNSLEVYGDYLAGVALFFCLNKLCVLARLATAPVALVYVVIYQAITGLNASLLPQSQSSQLGVPLSDGDWSSELCPVQLNQDVSFYGDAVDSVWFSSYNELGPLNRSSLNQDITPILEYLRDIDSTSPIALNLEKRPEIIGNLALHFKNAIDAKVSDAELCQAISEGKILNAGNVMLVRDAFTYACKDMFGASNSHSHGLHKTKQFLDGISSIIKQVDLLSTYKKSQNGIVKLQVCKFEVKNLIDNCASLEKTCVNQVVQSQIKSLFKDIAKCGDDAELESIRATLDTLKELSPVSYTEALEEVFYQPILSLIEHYDQPRAARVVSFFGYHPVGQPHDNFVVLFQSMHKAGVSGDELKGWLESALKNHIKSKDLVIKALYECTKEYPSLVESVISSEIAPLAF